MLAVITLLCPSVREDVRAAENQVAESQAADVPASAGSDSLAISVSNSKISLTADPAVNGGVAQSTIDISVKTTNTSGYTLKVSTPDTTSMRSTDTTNSATIQTIASNTTLANFPVNTWGYYVGDAAATASSTFRPFSTTATEVDATTTANSTLRTKKMTIAAKVGASLPAAVYSGDVTISVVTNAPKIEEIQYMQEMTLGTCAAMAEGYEKQLVDQRDGQKYWVGKMKDGRCWMLQNLALGSPTWITGLTPSDSNVSSNWTLLNAFTSATSGDASGTGTAVWNFGKWVLATPLLTTSCGDSSWIKDLSSCVKVGFVDVSDTTQFKPTFIAKTMAWNGANSNSSTLVTVNCTSWSGSGTSKTCTAGTYDAHYLVGNYYQWNAATAGTGAGITYSDAKGSICPKGWKLPTIGKVYENNDFYKLTNVYGVSSNVQATINGVTYNIAGVPLRFVRSGYVDVGNHVISVGLSGHSWSATASGSDGADFLSVESSRVSPSTGSVAYYGRSIRCINDPSI